MQQLASSHYIGKVSVKIASALLANLRYGYFCLNSHKYTTIQFTKINFYTKVGTAVISSKPKTIAQQLSGSKYYTMALNSFSQLSVQVTSDPQWVFQCRAQTIVSEYKLVLPETGLRVRRQSWQGWLRADGLDLASYCIQEQAEVPIGPSLALKCYWQ